MFLDVSYSQLLLLRLLRHWRIGSLPNPFTNQCLAKFIQRVMCSDREIDK